PATCDTSAENIHAPRLWGAKFLGAATRVYIVDVEGAPLALTVTYDPATMTPADYDEVDGIVASLHIGS
ncbi:MAG TPA: hypothetical protein VF484_07615, partial [Candidatus Limnocylindrales bacterium]